MTSTVLRSQTCHALHLSNRDPVQLLPDANFHDWLAGARSVEVAQVRLTGETFCASLILLSQLVRLASQHHASEYSRLKFGSQGSVRRRRYATTDGVFHERVSCRICAILPTDAGTREAATGTPSTVRVEAGLVVMCQETATLNHGGG